MRVICPSLASAPPHQNIITLFNQQSDGRLVTWKASQNPEGKIVTHPLHTKTQPLGATRGHLSRQPPGLSQISSRYACGTVYCELFFFDNCIYYN
jgi:hypothetical protein